MRFSPIHVAIIAIVAILAGFQLAPSRITPTNEYASTAVVYMDEDGDITKYITPDGRVYRDIPGAPSSPSDRKLSFQHLEDGENRNNIGMLEYAHLRDGTASATFTRLEWSFLSIYDLIQTYNRLDQGDYDIWIEAYGSLKAATELLVYRAVEDANPALVIMDTGKYSITYDAAIAERYAADPEGFVAQLDSTEINYSFGCRHHFLEVSLDEEFWNRLGDEYGELKGVSFLLTNNGTDTNTEIPCRMLPQSSPGPAPDENSESPEGPTLTDLFPSTNT